MIKSLLEHISNIDVSIFNVINKGILFSFGLCLISIFILLFFNTYPSSHEVFDAGLILFKTGLMFVVQFFICGLSIDTIKNHSN